MKMMQNISKVSLVVIWLEAVTLFTPGQTLSYTNLTTGNETLIGYSDNCPTWHIFNNKTKECTCRDLKDFVRCGNSMSNGAVSILYGYCMTYSVDTKETQVGKCIYTGFGRLNESLYKVLPQNPLELSQFMCSQWHRDGYLCSRCKDNYGLSIANFYMKCVQCTMREGAGWFLFFLLQLVPVTVLFVIVITFRLSITQPPLNAFVLHSQLSLALIYTHAAQFQTPYLNSSVSGTFVVLRSIFLPLLGVWNLRVFSFVEDLTNFCVNVGINQQFYFLAHITSVHVLLLIIMTFVCIELHGRNCRIIVCLWRPFLRCFIRCSRVWNSKHTAVDTFATFILLSHNRVVLLSYFTYAFQRVYTLNEKLDSKIVLLYNPELKYFDHNHLLYALINLLFLIILVFIPAITLALYQTKIFQECLNYLHLHNCLPLRIFVELFQGCYKDGTDGTRDLRFTASLYLFLRLSLLLAYILCGFSDFSGCNTIVTLILILATVMFIAVVQPYKDNRMNKVDIALLAVLVLSAALFSSVSESRDSTVNSIVLICVLGLLSIPQIVFYSFLVYRVSLTVIKLQCCRRIYRKCFSHFVDSRDELSLSQIDSIVLETVTSRETFTASYEEANSIGNG